MKNYENFAQIEYDLKVLKLEKQIALEELKVVKNNFQESLKPLSMLKGVAKFVGKYGLLVFIKKLFK